MSGGHLYHWRRSLQKTGGIVGTSETYDVSQVRAVDSFSFTGWSFIIVVYGWHASRQSKNFRNDPCTRAVNRFMIRFAYTVARDSNRYRYSESRNDLAVNYKITCSMVAVIWPSAIRPTLTLSHDLHSNFRSKIFCLKLFATIKRRIDYFTPFLPIDCILHCYLNLVHRLLKAISCGWNFYPGYIFQIISFYGNP